MKTLVLAALAVVSAAFALPATADDSYPNRPIHLVVPFAPGGGADLNARRIAQPLAEYLKQTIVIENIPGAGGTLGANRVARSTPDGYTLLYTTPGQQMTAPYLIENLPYDAFKSLRAVSHLTAGTNVLVVHKEFPVDSVQALIDYAREHPGEVNFASSGIGSTSHLAGELFKKLADIDIVHVPYRGTGPAAADVVGGRVQMSIDTLSVYLPHIKSGAVRALGVSTLEPNPIAPQIPPIAQTLPGFEASPVNYLTAPGDTPDEIVNRLSEAIHAIAAAPQLQEMFASTGTRLYGSTPSDMEEIVRREQTRWKDVIESAGISVKHSQ